MHFDLNLGVQMLEHMISHNICFQKAQIRQLSGLNM